MPARKSAESLKVLCLRHISQNFDLWCVFKQGSKSLCEECDYSVDPGPFLELPPTILEELIEQLKSVKYLRKQHLHYLIQPSIRHLNLSNGISDIYFALQFLTERCHNLQHLDISYQKHLSPAILFSTLEMLPNLRVLNMRKTMCSDGLLGVIGRNCNRLVSLNVSLCPVSDRGVELLGMDFDTCEPQCQLLVKLVVSDTNVSHEGAALALRAFPRLQEIDFSNLFDVFRDPRLLSSVDNEIRKLNITSIRSLEGEEISADTLDLVTKLCPMLSRVSILRTEIESESLLLLMNLNNLTELLVGSGLSCAINFNSAVLPLLQISGAKLKHLTLSQMASVNVVAIDQCCPALQELSLRDIMYFETHPTDAERAIFLNLQYFDMSCIEEQDVEPCFLKMMLSSCTLLEQIHIKRCACFDDVLLDEVLQANPLQKVWRISIEECNYATIGMFHELFLMEGELQSIRIWSCKSILQHDYHMLMFESQNKNLDMRLDWLGCMF